MHLELTDEQRLIAKTARDFADQELWPNANARDLSKEFPSKELKKLADLGLLAINVPSQWGGAEAGAVAYSLAMQEIARGDASVAVAMSVTNMVGELIATFGTNEQKEDIQKIASGQHVTGAFALSEPQAGSDPSAMLTTAKKVGDQYVLNGTKQWITNGGHAGIIVVWAKTDPAAGHKGISCFLVPGDAKELSIGRFEEKMGLNGSTTAQLVFDDVSVPASALLGKPGDGFKLAMMALDGGRIGIASQALGTAQRAFECAVNYSRERQTFGKPIGKHQAIGNMLADMSTALEAARLMTLRAAWLKESGQPFTKAASMAKLYASENAQKICDQALQIHGGYGYVKDFPLERLYRDVRVTTIYEGTSEIQRMVIARQLISETSI